MLKAHKPLLYCVFVHRIHSKSMVFIWFADPEGFALALADSDDERLVNYQLTDLSDDNDADKIVAVFEEEHFCIRNIENGADGISLEFECLSKEDGFTAEQATSISVALDSFAESRGFIKDAQYQKWVKGE